MKLLFRANGYYEVVLTKYWNYFKDYSFETYDNYLILVSDGGVYPNNVNQCEGAILTLKKLCVKIIMAATLEYAMIAFPEINELRENP